VVVMNHLITSAVLLVGSVGFFWQTSDTSCSCLTGFCMDGRTQSSRSGMSQRTGGSISSSSAPVASGTGRRTGRLASISMVAIASCVRASFQALRAVPAYRSTNKRLEIALYAHTP
jgi:hypothetical protein